MGTKQEDLFVRSLDGQNGDARRRKGGIHHAFYPG